MSGETPMSAFTASLLLNDSYWREFPRKRHMPSAQEQDATALRGEIQAVELSCVRPLYEQQVLQMISN